MVHRVIKETVIEYDQNGKITRRTITETREDDDSNPTLQWPWYIYQPNGYSVTTTGGVCDCSSKE